jgi:hypothetical protein
MQQFFNGAPQYVWDDGVTFNFDIAGFNNGSLGFFHRPIHFLLSRRYTGALPLRLSGPSTTTWRVGWRFLNTATVKGHRYILYMTIQLMLIIRPGRGWLSRREVARRSSGVDGQCTGYTR